MNEFNLTEKNSYCSGHLESETVRTAKLVSISFLVAFGIFGNVFTIVVAGKYTRKKSLHFLIINMAVSDTLLTTTILWYYITGHYLRFNIWNDMDGLLGVILCKSTFLFTLGFYSVSLLTLLIISYERYRVTRRNALVTAWLSAKKRGVVIVISWLFPVVINLDTLIYNQLVKVDGSLKCVTSLNIISMLITSAFQVSIILMCYFVMVFLNILTLRRLANPLAIEDSISVAQRQRRRKRMTSAIKMVLYSLLLHSLCYIPDYSMNILFLGFRYTSYYSDEHTLILHMISYVFSKCIDWPTLYFFCFYFLPLVNSSLSPLIYFVCLSDFREAARKLLCGKIRIQQLTVQENSLQPSVVQTTPM